MYRTTPVDAISTTKTNSNSMITSGNVALFSSQKDNSLRILRMKQLIERTQLSRSTLYWLIVNDPTFPRKIKLSVRTVGYCEFSVDAWIASRIAA